MKRGRNTYDEDREEMSAGSVFARRWEQNGKYSGLFMGKL